MKAQCPTCNTALELEALVEDASARAVFALIGQQPALVQSQLIPYLQLFKPRLQGLRWSRAQFLIQTQLDETLDAGPERLATALAETISKFSELRRQDNWRPLNSHNYLRRVIESVDVKPALTFVNKCNTPHKPVSKTSQVISFLTDYSVSDHKTVPPWFIRTICEGLKTLYIASLDGAPAADMIAVTTERWIDECWPKREWQEHCRFRGAKRLADTFSQMANTSNRWPSINDIVGQIPVV